VSIVAAKEKIEALKRSIGDYKVQKALADLTEMAAGMHGSIGLSDGTIDRVKEKVDERRNFAAGRARVARDAINMEEVEIREAEQAAMADAALARFESAVAVQAAADSGTLGQALDNALGTT
jgi:hypothetical protein